MGDKVYDFKPTNIKGEAQDLSKYEGKVLLIVNTASKCGFTPQYKGLEKLYKDYQSEGLEILGFPCNQFGEQEKGNDSEISQFCELNYGVSFPMFSKIDVNGKDEHPLYTHLKKSAPGLLGSKKIKWNFTKFLVDKNGKVVERFAPTTKPESLEDKIKGLLTA